MSKGKIIAGVVVLMIIGGVVAAVVLGRDASAPEVTVEQATRSTLAVTVSASGKTGADAKGDIYPPTAGTLASIDVTEGQSVKAGDIVAVMDTTPLELQVAQAEAAYEGALAQLDGISQSAPSSADKAAASSAVSAAYGAFKAANDQYNALKNLAPDPSTIAQAQAAVTTSQVTYQAAQAAYDAYKSSVYDPAPLPRDASMETALAVLSVARDQAYANYATAQQALVTLMAAQNTSAAVAAAKSAKDQAWAGYQAALAQQAKLASANTSAAKSSADAGVSAARDALDYANANLEKATMRAPQDGTIVFNGAAISLTGAAVGKPTVGGAVSPASAPFSVVYFDQLVFNAQVDEADIAAVKTGLKAMVTLDALPAKTFDSTVERIDKTSVVTPTGGTAFSVMIRLKETGNDVLLGMNGSTDIEIEAIEDVLTVPVEAVLDEAGKSYVFLSENGKAKKVEVTPGRLTDTRAEITSGIKAGDNIIVSGIGNLKDGATIRVK